MVLVGLDGSRDGAWVAATSDEHFRAIAFQVVGDLKPLISHARAGSAVLVIDIPIGISNDGRRACDAEARRLLGARASCVFTPPCRATLCADAVASYERACALNRRDGGRALSKQSHAILGRILEVDQLIEPNDQARVRETHPEVVFATLAGRAATLAGKKTEAGHRARLALLGGAGVPWFDPTVERLRVGRSAVALDDIIDAAGCLMVAREVHQARIQRLGDAARDARGVLMEIVVPEERGEGGVA